MNNKLYQIYYNMNQDGNNEMHFSVWTESVAWKSYWMHQRGRQAEPACIHSCWKLSATNSTIH